MRLLHSKELRFEEFFDSNIPKYAILSHRWGPDEVSYQEFLAIRNGYSRLLLELLELCCPGWFDVFEFTTHTIPGWAVAIMLSGELVTHSIAGDLLVSVLIFSFLLVLASTHAERISRPKQYGSGYLKILACCSYAATDNQYGPFLWVWIDTCSIDKSSSAELSESINSMYRWYHQAQVCYAYLSDVSEAVDIPTSEEFMEQRSREAAEFKEFAASQWFTRGWTLQELLAPRFVVFLASNWTTLGTRQTLSSELGPITGISETVLNLRGKSKFKTATILSWMANRKTSWLEDAAYCLLGLFDINLPLLYGEGAKSFQRLQMEIVNLTNDESLFVWNLLGFNTGKKFSYRHTGMLASNVSQFGLRCATSTKEFGRLVGISRPRYSLTNQGLELTVPAELARRRSFCFLSTVATTLEATSKVFTPYIS